MSRKVFDHKIVTVHVIGDDESQPSGNAVADIVRDIAAWGSLAASLIVAIFLAWQAWGAR